MDAVLLEWKITELLFLKRKILKIIQQKLLYLKQLSWEIILNIYDQFVVAAIDKDNGNAAFICKRFYMRVLIKKTWNRSRWYIKQQWLIVTIITISMALIMILLLINIFSTCRKNSKLKLCRTIKCCQVCSGSLSCAKVPRQLDLSQRPQYHCWSSRLNIYNRWLQLDSNPEPLSS